MALIIVGEPLSQTLYVDKPCLFLEKPSMRLGCEVPEREEDADALSNPSFGKMRGGLTAACHVVPDGVAPGVASIRQLAVQTNLCTSRGKREIEGGRKVCTARFGRKTAYTTLHRPKLSV